MEYIALAVALIYVIGGIQILLLYRHYLHIRLYEERLPKVKVLQDYCDGHFFKQYSVFKNHANALQLILYYDDIEVAHKLGMRECSVKA